jgi:hypothetical protein
MRSMTGIVGVPRHASATIASASRLLRPYASRGSGASTGWNGRPGEVDSPLTLTLLASTKRVAPAATAARTTRAVDSTLAARNVRVVGGALDRVRARGEMHDRACAGDRFRDRVGVGRLEGAERDRARRAFVAHDRPHVAPGGTQPLAQRAADEARRAGHDDRPAHSHLNPCLR